MSAIASFTRIPKNAIEDLREDYDDCLERVGQSVADYHWSGYVLGTLLPYLDKHGIKLMKSAYDELTTQLCHVRGETIFILTPEHRDAYLARLDPAEFSSNELRDYFNKFNAANEAEIGEAMLHGISALHRSISTIDADSVIVFSIG